MVPVSVLEPDPSLALKQVTLPSIPSPTRTQTTAMILVLSARRLIPSSPNTPTSVSSAISNMRSRKTLQPHHPTASAAVRPPSPHKKQPTFRIPLSLHPAQKPPSIVAATKNPASPLSPAPTHLPHPLRCYVVDLFRHSRRFNVPTPSVLDETLAMTLVSLDTALAPRMRRGGMEGRLMTHWR